MRANELLTQLRSSFAVRTPEKLGRLLAISAAVGVPVGLATPSSLTARLPLAQAALASAALVVLLPDIPRWLRGLLGAVFTVLVFGFGRELPTLLVLPALLGLVLFFEGKVTWPRALAFVAGPVLGALWHHALLGLFHPWNDATHALAVVLQASVGLFVGLGLAAAHVEWVGDAVAERLTGRRASDVWQRAQAALARLARSPERKRLERHVHEVAERYLAHQAEAATLRDAIAAVDRVQVDAELEQLAHRAQAATDAGARAHLEQAMRVHKDTLEQVDGLARQRERAEAKASAELARLERAALSLELAPPSGGLAPIAERLEALGAHGLETPQRAPDA